MSEEARDYEGFKITDDHLAEWAIRKIQDEQVERDRLIELCDKEIEFYQQKKEDAESKFKSSTAFLEEQLKVYFDGVSHKVTKTQESYKLASGTLVWKKPQRKLVPDKEKLVEYFMANDMNDLVKTTYAPNWSDFKSKLEIMNGKVVNTETGEEIEAVGIEETTGDFIIKENR